jgi:hypothetical protein
MNVLAWAERTLKTVEENGHAIARVKLMSVEGNAWETWEAPFPAPADFVRELETVTAALAEEWPKKKIQVLLVAEDTGGTVHSQCPYSVWGKNQSAHGALFSNDGSRALAEGMDQIVRTQERVLASANTQLRIQQEFAEKLMQQNHELLDYIRVSKEREALEAAQNNQVTNMLGDAFKEHLPLLLDVVQKLSAKSGGSTAGKILNGAKAAAKVAAEITPPVGEQQ